MEKNSEATSAAEESPTTGAARAGSAAEAATEESKAAASETAATPAPSAGETGDDPHAELRDRIVAKLHTVFDPEIPVDIYELGLIYDVGIAEGGKVHVKMTLTAPNCPVAGSLPIEVEQKVGEVEGVTESSVELVWEPQWTMDLMSEAAKLELGMA